MAYALDETIAALASAPGGAARAIVRLAGPDVAACLSECFEPAVENETGDAAEAEAAEVEAAENAAAANITTANFLADVRTASVLTGQVRLDNIAAPLPCDVYYWPDERSYTRCPMAEIHTLGSPPLAEALLRTVCTHGVRMAEPGEFTLRAFLGGRLDLTQAEAVLGVIDAHADQELDVALEQLAGGLSGPLTKLRDTLLELLAHLEAGLDFVEEDIEFISREQLLAQLDEGATQIQQLATQMQSRAESATAVRAVLLGAPNAGKSSLFNALAEAEHAIVSKQAGTTRDYLTADIDIAGVRCQLVDTAGVEEVTGDNSAAAEISAAAQDATSDQRDMAQLRLVCLDQTRAVTDDEQALLAGQDEATTIVVLTKCDAKQSDTAAPTVAASTTTVRTSSTTGDGLDELREAIADKLRTAGDEAHVVATTAVRCHDSLRRAAAALVDARGLADAQAGEELVAAELRLALDELGHVTGAVYTDDILDRIFSRFCIGK